LLRPNSMLDIVENMIDCRRGSVLVYQYTSGLDIVYSLFTFVCMFFASFRVVYCLVFCFYSCIPEYDRAVRNKQSKYFQCDKTRGGGHLPRFL